MRKKKADKVTESEIGLDHPAAKHIKKIKEIFIRDYLNRNLSYVDLLLEAVEYKTLYQVSEISISAEKARAGKKGGWSKNKDVIRNNEMIDKAITKLESQGIKVTGEALKKACDESTGAEDQVPEGAIKRHLRDYRAAKKAGMPSC